MKNAASAIESVGFAWVEFNHIQLEKAFCTLNCIFEEVILNYGENTYTLPHFRKDAILKRDGILSLRSQARQAPRTAVDIVMKFFLGDIWIFEFLLTFIAEDRIY